MEDSIKNLQNRYQIQSQKEWIKEIYTEDEISEEDCLFFGELLESIFNSFPDKLKKKKISILLTQIDKSSFDMANNIMNININKPRPKMIAEIFHEIGHVIEVQNPEILTQNRLFLSHRSNTNLEKIIEQSQLESTIKGNFIDPYIGKTYKQATEVLSMGLQLIYMNYDELKASDPSYLNLVESVFST